MASLLDPDPPPELPPGLLGIGAPQDEHSEALGRLYRAVMTNPVGTEVAPLPGQQSVGMPGGDFDPLVAMGSNGQPITARQVEAARLLREQGQGVAMNTVLGMTGNAPGPGFRAFHGSPHSFERFDTSKIGSGEGVQMFGHGLYVADREGVARGYRDDLSPPPTGPAVDAYNAANADFRSRTAELSKLRLAGAPVPPEMLAEISALQKRMIAARAAVPASGHMYEVQVNADPAHFLDWDRPLAEQSQLVQDKIRNLQSRKMLPQGWTAEDMATLKGRDLLQELRHTSGSEAKSAALLAEAVPGTGQGIPGIRYLDQGSRGAGEGSSNHVIFDAATMEILRKYGIAGLMLGGMGAGAAATYPQQ